MSTAGKALQAQAINRLSPYRSEKIHPPLPEENCFSLRPLGADHLDQDFEPLLVCLLQARSFQELIPKEEARPSGIIFHFPFANCNLAMPGQPVGRTLPLRAPLEALEPGPFGVFKPDGDTHAERSSQEHSQWTACSPDSRYLRSSRVDGWIEQRENGPRASSNKARRDAP